MHELTLSNLPQHAAPEPALVTALFSIGSIAKRFDEVAAPKAIDIWVANDILEVNRFSDQVIPIGVLGGTDYHLYIATTEVSFSYILVPVDKRLHSVRRRPRFNDHQLNR